LKRQRIRLTQIQDIAGIRLICADAYDQDVVVRILPTVVTVAQIDDRRILPSHGYRAVHVIVVAEGRHVEVQVRTRAQQQWAEVSEKLADLLDPRIKYGGGPANVREGLAQFAETVKICEELERQHRTLLDAADQMRMRASDVALGSEYAKLRGDAEQLELQVREQRAGMEHWLIEIAQMLLSSATKEPDDFSD
jgi:ppGpp synthetase/RelA/SpoT-type nucleotidyltranferase